MNEDGVLRFVLTAFGAGCIGLAITGPSYALPGFLVGCLLGAALSIWIQKHE